MTVLKPTIPPTAATASTQAPPPPTPIPTVDAFLAQWDATAHLPAAVLSKVRTSTAAICKNCPPDAHTEALAQMLLLGIGLDVKGRGLIAHVRLEPSDRAARGMLCLLAPLLSELEQWGIAEEAWRVLKETAGEGFQSLSAWYHLCCCLVQRGKMEECVEMCEGGLLGGFESLTGLYNPRTLGCLRMLTECYVKMGEGEKARMWAGRAWDRVREMGGVYKEEEEEAMQKVEGLVRALEQAE